MNLWVRHLLAGGLGALCALPLPVCAEPAPTGPPLPGTVIHAPRPAPGESERAPAAAVTVIDVSGFGGEHKSTAELLAHSPGVSVRSYGGAGQLETISLRGASAEQGLVLLDGVPLTSAAAATVNLAALPPAFLERIEVIRGTVGALYGPGALGGVVNLVTRIPHPGAPTLDAEILTGAFGTHALHAAAGGTLGQGSLLAGVSGLSTRGDFGYLPINGRTPVARANNDAHQLSGLARYTVRAGEGRRLDVQLQAEGDDRGLAGTVQNPSPGDHLTDDRQTASVRLTQTLAAGALELRAFTRRDRFEVTLEGARAGPQIDAALGAVARARLDLGAHALTFSAEAAGERLILPAQVLTRPELAASVAEAWTLGIVTLLPALRVDRVDVFTGLSPRLAIALEPTPGLSLRASLGRSFRAPGFAELHVDQGLLTANPDLRPETASAADLGATLAHGPLSLSVGGFASLYEDLIVYELYPPFRTRPFNVGTASIVGAEVELSVHPLRGLEAGASYTLMATRDLLDDARYYGHALAHHPRHSGSVRVAWTGARFTAHLDALAQSAQFVNRASTTAVAARVEANLGASVRLTRSLPLWLGLELKNLLDDHTEDLYGYPQPGRALYASLRFTASPQKEHP